MEPFGAAVRRPSLDSEEFRRECPVCALGPIQDDDHLAVTARHVECAALPGQNMHVWPGYASLPRAGRRLAQCRTDNRDRFEKPVSSELPRYPAGNPQRSDARERASRSRDRPMHRSVTNRANQGQQHHELHQPHRNPPLTLAAVPAHPPIKTHRSSIAARLRPGALPLAQAPGPGPGLPG